MSNAYAPNGSRRRDPQVVVQGELRQGPVVDLIVFRLNLLLLELTFIVNVPPDGETTAPVYVKFRVMPEHRQRRPAPPSGSKPVDGWVNGTDDDFDLND